MSRLDSAAVMDTPAIDGPEGADVPGAAPDRPFPMQMHPRHRLGGWRLMTPDEVEKQRATGGLVESESESCPRGGTGRAGPAVPASASA